MKNTLYLIGIVLICFSCSSDNGSDTNISNYDKQAMLINWADNLIIPAFTDYQTKTEDLETKSSAFVNTPNTATLGELRTSWKMAYVTFQNIGIFDIGKATDLHLIETANTYPTTTASIDANIASGDYNLSAQTQFASQGFPALDYLLYGIGETDQEILAFYTTDTNADNYKQYITDLTAKLKSIAVSILADWNNGYRTTYINNSNAVTGSLNQTANNFVEDFEKVIRAPKVGIPAGKFSNGALFPEKVEAYYNNTIGKSLLIESIDASLAFFEGKTYGTNITGPSLKAYLNAVDAQASGLPLSTIITDQYDAILITCNLLSNSLSDQVTADNSKMLTTYDALQQNVVYLKVDMISALGLTIDYVDGDGD
ncbi:imelysin family protein [Formosa sp. PL04]|uniref:imelysin family protein n=1 Tax=Formosa sp. PL04 TaxID=3081755 RepID=UPI002980AE07|nr:imelysin family protein [Formosa sp. PL04]MDW5290340.1 imelysin family protein [Formosa sp. PL04]